MRFIVSVENPVLRDALASVITALDCQPEVILPDALLQTELAGCVFILLETSNDVERLINTAAQVYNTWGATRKAELQFLSYSTEAVTLDSIVFRLWSIGQSATVTVQTWNPEDIQVRQSEAHALINRFLQFWDC